MGAVYLPGLAAGPEALSGVLADRAKHREAWLLILLSRGGFGSRHKQAVIHEGGQRLQKVPFRFGTADGLGRSQRKVPGEDGEAPEQ